MSRVTSIVLSTGLGDDTGVDELNAWLESTLGGGQILIKVSQHAGGSKAFEHDVYVAALKNCDAEKIVEKFRAASWEYPENAQIFILDDNDDLFKSYEVEPR